MSRPAVFRIWNEKTPSKKTDRLSTDRAITTAQERMRRNGGPVQFWNFKTATWSRLHTISRADGALATRLRENKVGQHERIRCRNGAIIRVNRVQMAYERPYDWKCLTPLARGFHGVCATVDPEGHYLGGYNYRPASHNPRIISTHGYGEAIDWDPSSMKKGDEIRAELKKKYGDRVTVVWRTTNHFGHGHHEEYPSRVHTPGLCGK